MPILHDKWDKSFMRLHKFFILHFFATLIYSYGSVIGYKARKNKITGQIQIRGASEVYDITLMKIIPYENGWYPCDKNFYKLFISNP